MSTTPPAGYGVMTWTWSVNGTQRKQVNTYGFRNVAGAGALGCLTALSTAFFGTSKPYDDAVLSLSYTLDQQYVLLNTGGVLTSAIALPANQGAGTNDAPPPNVSVVVRKTTALAGRQYRGRIAYPAGYLEETDIDIDGTITGGPLTTIQNRFNAAFAAASGADLPIYLLHGPNLLGVTPVPTLVTSFIVDSLCGSQRKRIRR